MLRYKAQFQSDALQDIYKLIDTVDQDTGEIKDISSLDLEVFYNLAWALAKTADPSIPTPMEWLDTFGEFPLTEIIPQVIDLIISCITPTAQSKKNS